MDAFVQLAVLHCVPDTGGDVWVGKIIVGVPRVVEGDLVAQLLESMIEVMEVDDLVHFLGLEQRFRVYP